MSSYLLLPLVQSFLALALAAIIAVKGGRHRLASRLFILCLVGLGIWGLLIYGMRSSPDAGHALSWERWLTPVSLLIPIFFFHFSLKYTLIRVRNWFIPVLYLLAVITVPLSNTGLFFQDMQVKNYGYAPVFGPLMPFSLIFSTALMLWALGNFARLYWNSVASHERTRTFYIMLAAFISLVGMAFDILPVFGLPAYPGFIIGNIIFCILTSVAILKHHLLDINIVLRKGAAYFLASSSFIFIVIIAWMLVSHQIGNLPQWAHVVILATLSLIMAPLWYYFQRQVDRLFYRQRHNHLTALETFSRETQSLADPNTGKNMTILMGQAIHASSAYIMLPASPNRDFTVRFASGNIPLSAKFDAQSPLIHWLSRTGSMVSIDEIKVMPYLSTTEKETLIQLDIELVAPGITQAGRLTGLVLLGKKLSGQPYNNEDKQLITVFTNQIATKLDNIALFTDTEQIRHELQKLSRRLVEVQEEERRQIARELHDEIAQSLAMAKILVDKTTATPQKNEGNLTQVQTILKEVIGQVREISLNLRPSILDDLGLLPALEWYLNRYTSRTNVRVDFRHEGLETQLPAHVRTTAYRVVQEGLSNIIRHAKTDRARLSISARGNRLHIELLDYGIGFDPRRVNSNSTGIMGMRERVTMLSGSIRVNSRPGEGTRLIIDLPLAPENKN